MGWYLVGVGFHVFAREIGVGYAGYVGYVATKGAWLSTLNCLDEDMAEFEEKVTNIKQTIAKTTNPVNSLSSILWKNGHNNEQYLVRKNENFAVGGSIFSAPVFVLYIGEYSKINEQTMLERFLFTAIIWLVGLQLCFSTNLS